MKIKALGSVLAKRFGVGAAEGLVPNHPTLGDVDSAEALAELPGRQAGLQGSSQSKRLSVLAYATGEPAGRGAGLPGGREDHSVAADVRIADSTRPRSG